MYAVGHSRTDAAVKVFLARKAKEEAEEKKRERELRLQHELEITRAKKEIMAGEAYRKLENRIEALETELEAERKISDAAQKLLSEARAQITILTNGSDRFLHSYGSIERRAIKVFGITKRDLMGHSRARDIAFARQFVMYWATRLTLRTYPEIGRFLCRDHTSVIHGARVYPEKRAEMGRHLRPIRSAVEE